MNAVEIVTALALAALFVQLLYKAKHGLKRYLRGKKQSRADNTRL